MKKLFSGMLFAAVMTAVLAMTCFAGTWQQNEKGRWWDNGDGTWPAACWQWCDGDGDGTAECYYFDNNGYVVTGGITPDGYTVDQNGAWTENGQVQTKLIIVYTKDRIVMLSRHNIRSPLSDGDSLLGKVTPHEWFAWTSPAGELSVKGGQLETAMGQYFREKMEAEGFIPENWIPENGQVRFYTNSLQRTIATGRYFAAGLLPMADVKIEHKNAVGEMDKTFAPFVLWTNPQLEAVEMAEIREFLGTDVKTCLTSYTKELNKLEEILDFKDSAYAKENGVSHLPTDDTYVGFKAGEEVILTGGLSTVNSIVDALKLQIYEEPDMNKALFGHKATYEELRSLTRTADAYQKLRTGTHTLAACTAYPMLKVVQSELTAKGRKFTFLGGHDSTLMSVLAALDVEPYELPDSISMKTPIGGKAVFEVFTGSDGVSYAKVTYYYASFDELRNGTTLSLDIPPKTYELSFKGLQKNADGYYRFDDLMARFNEACAIHDYYYALCEDEAA